MDGRRKQTGTDKISSVSQCIRMQWHPELDSALPRRCQPQQQEVNHQNQQPPSRLRAQEQVALSPPHTRTGHKYGEKEQCYDTHMTSMVEVAGTNGAAVLIHRPWTMTDMRATFQQ